MLLNLDGGATALFPYLMDQDPEAHPGSGWFTSLDWTPGDLRFQVDRKVKVNGGKGLESRKGVGSVIFGDVRP
jgi:hypothetical protein